MNNGLLVLANILISTIYFQVAIIATSNTLLNIIYYIIMFNGVLLVAIIATWILKVTSLPKLYYIFICRKI